MLSFSIETELFILAKKKLFPCYNCDLCINQRRCCPAEDDWLNIVIKITKPTPNGLNFGSAVYFFDVNTWLLIMGFVTVGGFYIGGGGWTHEDESRDAIRRDELGLESARLVGQKVAKTAILLKRGAATFKEKLPFVLWKGQEPMRKQEGGELAVDKGGDVMG